jgi:hypothetical protein
MIKESTLKLTSSETAETVSNLASVEGFFMGYNEKRFKSLIEWSKKLRRKIEKANKKG